MASATKLSAPTQCENLTQTGWRSVDSGALAGGTDPLASDDAAMPLAIPPPGLRHAGRIRSSPDCLPSVAPGDVDLKYTKSKAPVSSDSASLSPRLQCKPRLLRMPGMGRHVPTTFAENYSIGPAASATSAAIRASPRTNGPPCRYRRRSVTTSAPDPFDVDRPAVAARQ